MLTSVLLLTSCQKNSKCPDYASGGCGCYDTGNNSFGTPFTPTEWDASISKCYYINNLGIIIYIDKKYCPCR